MALRLFHLQVRSFPDLQPSPNRSCLECGIYTPNLTARLPWLGMICLGFSVAVGQQAGLSPGAPAAEPIAWKLNAANLQRAEQLDGYTAERHYTVSYRGFPGPLTASMVVDVTYTAPSTKTFRIVSHSGAKLLFDEVLTKLLKSEQEAAHDPAKTALSPDNYTFTLLGQQMVEGRHCYLLHAESKTESKFLYRGKVWVDAEDYAVTQIEAAPAKDPSFWIKDTKVHHVYAKTAQFWLPASIRSETVMRFGGTAVLTIDYGTYSVMMAAPH